MNEKSMTASSQPLPSMRACPITIASPSPVLSSASASRSVYGRRSKKWSGSSLLTPAASSTNEPSSASDAIRERAFMAKWCPH
ncbi:MAG: hypothetical protein E6G50_07590 [Actinobacteria bacterium]|nr:MAG: hypothetical protein E6G50_07590 [Actinomycetota bacterium]